MQNDVLFLNRLIDKKRSKEKGLQEILKNFRFVNDFRQTHQNSPMYAIGKKARKLYLACGKETRELLRSHKEKEGNNKHTGKNNNSGFDDLLPNVWCGIRHGWRSKCILLAFQT